MKTLLDRDREWLTEIGKLGADIAKDVGGSQAIQSAVVQSVMMIMAQQDTNQRATYQFEDIEQQSGKTKSPKRRL